MGFVLIILMVVVVLVVSLWEFIELPLGIFLGIREDFKNRNDRGKLKHPSDKYVSR